MTRKSQKRTLSIVVAGLVALIAAALVSKLSGAPLLLDFYDFIRDTSLLIATVVAAYLTGVYQQRNAFLQSLREQWREIVEAKGALIHYCHLDSPSLRDYLSAARQLSQCIDNMRIVYANVGETEDLIGYYPYAPLHQMRIVMEGLDPRKGSPSADQRFEARGKIWDAFNAIREHFLDEFDIEEPTKPILIHGMKRRKRDGASPRATRLYKKQSSMER